MKKIAVLAITKNGIEIGLKLKEYFSDFEIFAPIKFSNDNEKIQWYENSTTQKIVDLFKNNDGIICLFSLGAVIRLLAPHIKDKKTDPAVIVIDDNANFVISVLSGHLGGANELSNEIAEKMGSTPIITTAADVNKTIAVDLVGREFGWKINDDSNVTRISAFMVNKEKIGVFQNIGKKEWWKGKLPENITFFSDMKELKDSDSKAYLIITNDEINDEEVEKDSVVYRVPNLVVGIGLHWNTSKETILNGVNETLEKFELKQNQIARFVSIKKDKDVIGLIELGKEMNIPIEYIDREELATITAPNPSKTVQAFEGTASVSEAAAIKSSEGELIVEKQKFPPNLTVAIARMIK
ncbi:MAG: precorrin-3B C(17)-methyltransferase [Thaumarchaeota archaeon]|jgi:cobalt-precorrin 5A hydrolase|nr:precorrin-3B C(17)-methyltransferase [Nitrososphaerota archaeon]MBT3743191.1 precorrin-3B C(17)-methyltransferase [Nitrososphaerota archaeon]MBT4057011.1 precorrin-3B C(17)-methyltransferase [Nitrososphaerota archaeon]MBT4175246.1 precorrin-3B C(17)-methyltransferase [Nitrososphaerota archaeon]MBT4510226.1 precorrin-3B C(17)-methyltransferase [Nitrososphaerota archaeon]